MSELKALISHYQKWLEISQQEHQSILEKEWDRVNQYRDQKLKILEHIQQIEASFKDFKLYRSPELNLLIHKLTDLETQNNILLQERIKEVKTQMNDLSRRKRLVEQLRDRYSR